MKTYFVTIHGAGRFGWVEATNQRHALQLFARQINLPVGTRFYVTARETTAKPIVGI